MRVEEYADLDAVGLSEQISAGKVTAEEVAQAASAAIEQLDGRLNAVVEVFQDAIADPYSDGMSSNGPFCGVPMLVKDLLAMMKGRRQSGGYQWLSDYIAEEDSPLVSNLRRAGFNLIGRTSVPEGGGTIITESRVFGVTRNPWNPEHTPGGSSGGSAAAVSSGMVPIASASDGGGSTRIPASWTGLIGLKPTRGLLPHPPLFNEAHLHHTVEGVLTRSIRDTVAALDHLTEQPAYGWQFMPTPAPPRPYEQAVSKRRDKKYRIAMSTGSWGREGPCDSVLQAAVHDVARRLQGMGHDVQEIEDREICDFVALFESSRLWFWLTSWGVGLPARAKDLGRTLDEGNLSVRYLEMIAAAQRQTHEDYFRARQANAVVHRSWARLFQNFEMVLTPVTPIPCPPTHCAYRLDATGEDLDTWLNRLFDAVRYTLPANYVGLPAVAFPVARDANGLPVGAQLYAPWMGEPDVLSLVTALSETESTAFSARPPIYAGAMSSDSSEN